MNPGEGNGKIYVGIPRERILFPEFVDNRDKVLTSIDQHGLSCDYYQAGGHRVDRNRDRIVHGFLAQKDKPEWLLMVDSDMEHIPDVGERLAAHKKHIVGVLYFHRGEFHDPLVFMDAPDQLDEYGRLEPMWTPMRDDVYDFLASTNLPMVDMGIAIDGVTDGLREVDAVGTGAILIHRSVIEAMLPGPWFEYEAGGTSEDLAFCRKAKRKYGFQVYCDFATISGHYALVPMGQAQFRMLYEMRGLKYSAYTPNEAVTMLADFYHIPNAVADEELKAASSHSFGDYWKTLNIELDSNEEWETYRKPSVAREYVKELIYWNASPQFESFRKRFVPIRNRNLIEFGSGIGTLTLQLLMQNNNVLSIEVNPVLRKFTKTRFKNLDEKLRTKTGELTLAGDEWFKIAANGQYDAAFAIDVFEHINAPDLRGTLQALKKLIKPGGRLHYHANWEQQEQYPMHHDHSKIWDELLRNTGYYPLTPFEALRM